MNGNLSHFNGNGNVYMTLLSEATALHRTARQKHLLLLDKLKADKVKWKDIQLHLVNQAKSCHLYTRDLWNPAKNQMDFRPLRDLTHFAWANAIVTFVSWAKSNYKNYDVPKTRKARKNDKPAKVVVIREKQQPLSAPPKTAPSVTGVKIEPKPETFNTADVQLEKPKPKATAITAPVPASQELTLIQKQQIILSNLDILGNLAKEKGAGFEFNELMVALGTPEFILEDVA